MLVDSVSVLCWRGGFSLGPFWVHFGSVLGPFWVRLGFVLGPLFSWVPGKAGSGRPNFCGLSVCAQWEVGGAIPVRLPLRRPGEVAEGNPRLFHPCRRREILGGHPRGLLPWGAPPSALARGSLVPPGRVTLPAKRMSENQIKCSLFEKKNAAARLRRPCRGGAGGHRRKKKQLGPLRPTMKSSGAAEGGAFLKCS